MIRPGEIYLADFAEAGPHPVIVVSREELNRGHYALVVVCTSARFAVRSQLPNCVPFRAGAFGFTTDCVAQCENLFSIDLAQIDLSAIYAEHLFHSTFGFTAGGKQQFRRILATQLESQICATIVGRPRFKSLPGSMEGVNDAIHGEGVPILNPAFVVECRYSAA